MKNVRRIFVLAMALSILMVIQAVPALARTIYGNGTGGIYIDIEASPYSDAWDPRWGKPYADTGCTWFAEARTEQLTGINCAGIIYGVDQWWNTKYAEFGFSRSSSLSRQYKSLACWSSPHIAVVEGFTSSGAIIVSEGGVSSSKVNSSHGYCRISTFDSEAALTSKNSGFLGYIILPVEAVGGNRAPYGYFDGLEVGNGCIRVTGWAKDDDTPDQPIDVHVYVGGAAGSGAPCYGFSANRYRSDVGNHAFDEIIYTNKTGSQSVYIYAIDPVYGSHNPQIGVKTAVFNGDTQPPVISNVHISDVSSKGYTVTCDVSDDVALDRVAFPTWTMNNGQDDIIQDWEHKALGTISNGKATYRVNIADHNNETHCEYRTHIYAWDKAGNQAMVSQQHFPELSFILPAPLSAPEITDVSVNGNTIHVEWNESPLIDANDVRTYKFEIRCNVHGIIETYYSQEGIVGNSITIRTETLKGVEDDFYAVRVYAVNETTHEVSEKSARAISYTGEFKLPGEIDMEEDEAISISEFIDMITTQTTDIRTIRSHFDKFKLQSSDPAVLETRELTSMQINTTDPMLIAKKPGTVELKVWFEGQCNTVRAATVKVKSMKDMDNTLPQNVKTIDEEAFMGTSMASIAIPDGCTAIGARAFANSDSLKKIYIPASVTSISFDAFKNCPNLTIYGEEGSAAIQLAETLGIPYRTVE